MRILKYLGRRLMFIIPQLLGVFVLTFFAARAIPGDPARIMAGSLISEEGLEAVRERMGLSGTYWEQFVRYVKNILHGDLGNSWVTGNAVLDDIKQRLPATLQLIILALIIVLLIMVPIALKSMNSSKSVGARVSQKVLTGYGMAAGAFPDFWLALILIFLFYATWHITPSPVGQAALTIGTPKVITGFTIIDAILTANWKSLGTVLGHLILPVFTLAFVYGGGIVKITVNSAGEFHKSNFINYARISGMNNKKVNQYVKRASYPPIATMTAVVFGFLIGGAVLIEQVFSWGGFGQYAVSAIINSDFNAIQGVVLVIAVLNLLAYIIVDIIYMVVDPRITNVG